MNKRAILIRIDGKISDIHESMETGLPRKQYNRKVGAVQELRDLRDWILEVSDDDDDDGSELEEMDT